MANQELLVRVMSEFARTLAGNFAVSDVLHDLAEQVTEVLGVQGAGVSLADTGSIRFVAAMGEVTATIERVQEEAQEGPCVDAHRTGELVLVADIRDEAGRWPTFAARARELGITAFKAGTSADQAELVLERAPLEVCCLACGRLAESANGRCPLCGSDTVLPARVQDICLKSVEIEV